MKFKRERWYIAIFYIYEDMNKNFRLSLKHLLVYVSVFTIK